MKKLNLLERELDIDQDYYDFELDEQDNVVEINLYDSEYSDFPSKVTNLIEILSQYTSLKSINIDVQELLIKDISHLSSLKQLEVFCLEGSSEIEDLSVFGDLTEMKEIAINNAKISDVSPLAQLLKLKSLSLSNNQITNIDAFSDLINIEHLNLSGNKLSNLESISNLKRIKTLALSETGIDNLEVIANLNALTSLFIAHNHVDSLEFLEGIDDLYKLDFRSNRVSEANVLKKFNNLSYLLLENNHITDISFLNSLNNLIHLDISNNPVRNFTPVFSQKKIVFLSANNIDINHFDGFHNLKEIQSLHLENCSIDNLSFLKENKNLIRLNLNNNTISDVTPLSNLLKLTNICLANNKIDNFFPIYLFHNLNELDLQGNAFGNQYYTIYEGYYGLNTYGKTTVRFENLNKLVGEYFFNKGKYEEALAYYYFRKEELKTLSIYVHLFEKTNLNEMCNLRYFYKRCNALYFSLKHLFHIEIPQQLEERVRIKIEAIQHLDTNNFFNFPERSHNMYDFGFDLVKSNSRLEEKIKNDEYYYTVAYEFLRERDDIMKALYFLKEFKSKNSPFYYRLFNDARECLKMRFAYTESERLEYQKYFTILDNFDSTVIPFFDYDAYYRTKYSYRFKDVDYQMGNVNRVDVTKESYLSNQEAYALRFQIILFLFLAVVLVICLLWIIGRLLLQLIK